MQHAWYDWYKISYIMKFLAMKIAIKNDLKAKGENDDCFQLSVQGMYMTS